MKKTLKAAILSLCLILVIGTLASCNLQDLLSGILGGDDIGGSEKPEWKPTGAEITLIAKGAPGKYSMVYQKGDELALSAARDLKSTLKDLGLETSGAVITTSVSDFKNEIIVGPSERQVSIDAMALLEEKMADSDAELHCVFHYYDGKLAIVANNELAYEMAITAFIDNYYKNSSIVLVDTLKEHFGLAENDFLEIKLENFLEGRENVEKKHEKDMESLLAKLETQRDEITKSGVFGTSTKNIGASNWGEPIADPISEHPRLFLNSSTLPMVKRSLMLSDATSARILEYFEATIVNDSILPAPKYQGTNSTVDSDNVYNFNADYLERIQIKALAYLVTEDPYYGYEAILYLKNYIKSLDIVKIASDQCRQYGAVMCTAAIVYDWCYPLLTDLDKEQIIAGVENCICRGENEAGAKMEVGFPPAGQGVVSGHGSERQILRDYLSFAAAIYGDNDSWWDYIAARVCNDYAPMRNLYYQSGMVHQGTGYIQGRYISDLFSAWIMKTATGVDLYEGQDTVTRSLLGLECAPGKLFNDGDKTGDSFAASNYLHIAYITAYLYDDPTLLAQANHLLGDETFSNNYNYLSSVLFAAVRGLSDIKPAEDRYEGMDLIQYNGAPLGQYVIRQAWNSENSAAVIMRIKERTTANHEHKDSGTFEIYYKGALSTDGGCYNNYGHEHTQYFHHATISHNGLIIYNPNLASSDKGWYSGGQRRLGETATLKGWSGSSYDTGEVTGRQHGYADEDKTSPLYAYIAGDITKAYAADTVNYVGRRMLTVYTGDEDFPMAFFVYDDITSDKKTFKKTFLLQISSDVAPVIDEKEQTVTTEHEGGKLILTCLSDDVKIEGIGGRNEGKYSAAESQNYMINGKQLSPKSDSADDGHWGRVEISNAKDGYAMSFLNVITVTDAGNKKMPTVRDVSSAEGVEGAVFDKKIVALFATSKKRATSELSCKTAGSAEMSYYVSGVAEGEWTVTVDGKKIGSFEASAEGGLLTFTAPAGDITITPAK